MDTIQSRLTSYACGLNYDELPVDVVHAAKVRVIDTLGALIGGFFGQPLRIARDVAARVRDPNGATILGTRIKTTPDMAAFANAGAAHHIEMQDIYHHCHPSDVVTPVLSVAEHANVTGRDCILGIVLAYEVFCRVADVFKNQAFDYTNFACLGAAVGAGKVLLLPPSQLSHCISMAVVPNVSLRQEKEPRISMWKEIASGQAARAGVFAALLARAGMEGPHLPFEGKAGWCDHVAKERFSLDEMGGHDIPFRISETSIKNRPAGGSCIAPMLAAEKIAPIKDVNKINRVVAEVYYGRYYQSPAAKEPNKEGDRFWNPVTQGNANHSYPYVVATTLLNGRVTPHSYSDAQVQDPKVRALMQKIDIVVNDEFAKAHKSDPPMHRARVTVTANDGSVLVGEAGGDQDDLAAPRSDSQVSEKFRELSEEYLGVKRVTAILEQLWHLETLDNVSRIPPGLMLD